MVDVRNIIKVPASVVVGSTRSLVVLSLIRTFPVLTSLVALSVPQKKGKLPRLSIELSFISDKSIQAVYKVSLAWEKEKIP